LKVAWSTVALRDFEEATDCIAMDKPVVAQQVAQRILEATGKLCDYPYIGHPGDDEGTREWLVRRTPYCWFTRSSATLFSYCGSGTRAVGAK